MHGLSLCHRAALMGVDPWPLSSTPQKYDYDSSTVRKKFFREALLQITIPFLLKKLAPTCKGVSSWEDLSVEVQHPWGRGAPTSHPDPSPLAGASQVPGAHLRGLCQLHPGGEHI